MLIHLQSLTGTVYDIYDAQEWDTIGALKIKISVAHSIQVEEQKLIVRRSSGDFIPDDTAVLSELGIVQGMTLNIVIKSRCFYEVVVAASPNSFTLKMKPTDTVLCLRRQIADKSHVRLDDQILVWQSKQLQSQEYSNCTLESLGFSFDHPNNVNLTTRLRGG